MYNSSDRDGMGCCEGLGYNFGCGLAKVCPLAQQLREAGVDIYARPRIQQIIRAPIRPIVAGKWYPSIGDGGSWRGLRAGRYCRASWMGPLVAEYDDVLVAQALVSSGQGLGPYQEKVEALTAAHGRDIPWQSRVLGPFGLAIFESGTDDDRRGLTCYYGGNTAHGHFDRLTISLFNSNGPVTPDLGYPHMGFGERSMRDNNTVSHTTVVVNARKQLNREPGYLTAFTVTPTAKALEVGGEAAYRGIVSQYKRTLIWVDVGEHNSYLVDVFRVAGGAQHDYSVHGASADVSVSGATLCS